MLLFDNVKNLCQSKNITIAQLEREVGVGSSSIQKWKKTSPSAENLIKVADYFGVTVDYLLGRNCTVSTKGRDLAKKFDALPSTKQALIEQYIGVLQTE